MHAKGLYLGQPLIYSFSGHIQYISVCQNKHFMMYLMYVFALCPLLPAHPGLLSLRHLPVLDFLLYSAMSSQHRNLLSKLAS